MIAALAASAAIAPEPHDARLLLSSGGGLVAQTPAGTRKRLLDGVEAAAYSPDGTFLAFTRGGDLWLANADGSGQRRLLRTPNVAEWKPSWLPDGSAIVYSAEVDGAKQIRVFRLPVGPSQKLYDGSGAAVSRTGKIAYVANGNTIMVGDQPFDTTPTAYAQVTGLSWSPDGTKLVYSADGTIVVDDGTTQTPAAPGASPVWSPDGTKLAYSADGNVVVDDGTTQLTGPPGTSPVWSPDGTRIAFSSGLELESMAADGTDIRDLGATGTPVDWRTVPIGAPKFPNLVQRPPSGLVIERARNGHWLLGFTSMVDNRGPGILWIKGTRAPGSHVMQVRQYVQLANGTARIDPASGELHYVVAPPHYHWHMIGFVHAELRTAGDFQLRVRDHKSGFCIADHYGTAIGVPHGPPRFLSNCEQFNPHARKVVEGASVGYTDRSPAFFHGQQLDINGLTAGRYWLVHRANEDFHLRESRYDDNVASVLIRLTWRGGTPSVVPLRVCSKERC